MGKKDKKVLGIKTTRYFTKNCSKCGFEYPNWFTNCPKCGAAWDEMEAKAFTGSPDMQKKTIKIGTSTSGTNEPTIKPGRFNRLSIFESPHATG